jgi:GNAT superfamily N-acetyltransferase
VLQSTLEFQLLTPGDWRLLREARLEALRESPHAFMSTYAHESTWGEAQWRRAFEGAIWIVAHDAESVIGLAASVREPKRSATRHVESVWVTPRHRLRGVSRALIHELAEVERRMGVYELLLWVLEDNRDAQRAYRALGFQPTGERQPLPVLGRFERRLRLGIASYRSDASTRAAFEPTTASSNRASVQVSSSRMFIAARILRTLLSLLENVCHSDRSSRQS